jgi:hypothetical protein
VSCASNVKFNFSIFVAGLFSPVYLVVSQFMTFIVPSGIMFTFLFLLNALSLGVFSDLFIFAIELLIDSFQTQKTLNCLLGFFGILIGSFGALFWFDESDPRKIPEITENRFSFLAGAAIGIGASLVVYCYLIDRIWSRSIFTSNNPGMLLLIQLWPLACLLYAILCYNRVWLGHWNATIEGPAVLQTPEQAVSSTRSARGPETRG